MVDVPELTYLMIDGHGDPNTSDRYRDAVTTLYALSYSVKFQIKRASGVDFKVGPLEGLWWGSDMSAFTTGDKSAWDWTMMIRQHDVVAEDLVAAASRCRPRKACPLRPTSGLRRSPRVARHRSCMLGRTAPRERR
jgi:hypothetical protein